MPNLQEPHDEPPPSLETAPTIYPTSPPVEELIGGRTPCSGESHPTPWVFWDTGPEFDSVRVRIEPPDKPLDLLERLGPSPFERGGFPLIGFLATTYDKVSRYALERR